MRKKILATILCLAAQNSFGSIPPQIYGGFGAGLDLFVPQRNVEDTLVDGSSTTSKRNTDSATGADLTGFLGVKQRIYGQFALAAELSGTLSSAETEAKIYNFININNTTAIAKIRNKGNFALSLLPSFNLNKNSELFLRGGFSRGRFEARSEGSTGGDLIATGTSSTWLSGYVVGLGLQTEVTCYMSARLEYDYSHYQDIRNQSTLPLTLTGDTISSKVTPADHAVTLSVVFNDLIGIS